MLSVDPTLTAHSTRLANNLSARTLVSCAEPFVDRTPFVVLNSTDPFASVLTAGEVTRKKTVSDVSSIATKYNFKIKNK